MMFVYAGSAIFFSFLCSVAEAVLLSVRPAYVQKLVNEGRATGQLLTDLKKNVDRPLAAILTLNTIAHTVGAGGAGAKAQLVFGDRWFGVSMIVLTLLILFASEIIPKTIGATYWKSLAPITARTLKILIWILWPFIFISERMTKWFSGGHAHSRFSREEFAAMAEIGTAEGKLDADEARIFGNLLNLVELKVQDVFTPRTMVFFLQQDRSVADVLAEEELTYTRIPVFRESIDDVTGFVLKTDLLLEQAHDRHRTPLHKLIRPLHGIPASASLSNAFKRFIKEGEHAFLVVDEYGGTQGILSLEDVLETLIGEEIVDEVDKVADLQEEARRRHDERFEDRGEDS